MLWSHVELCPEPLRDGNRFSRTIRGTLKILKGASASCLCKSGLLCAGSETGVLVYEGVQIISVSETFPSFSLDWILLHIYL